MLATFNSAAVIDNAAYHNKMHNRSGKYAKKHDNGGLVVGKWMLG